MKIFFGVTFIEREKLKEAGIKYPIKIEYYKQINEEENSTFKTKYGIYMVETKYKEDKTIIKSKILKYITNDEIEENKILKYFKEKKVTIINAEEVIADFFRTKKINVV